MYIVCIYVYVLYIMYVCIYIYIERERDYVVVDCIMLYMYKSQLDNSCRHHRSTPALEKRDTSAQLDWRFVK